MNRMPPEGHDVLVVTSRPAAPEGRRFRAEPPEGAEAPDLPEDLSHEDDLVEWLRERGWRLTMVGGGSRPDEVRRFYFRPG